MALPWTRFAERVLQGRRKSATFGSLGGFENLMDTWMKLIISYDSWWNAGDSTWFCKTCHEHPELYCQCSIFVHFVFLSYFGYCQLFTVRSTNINHAFRHIFLFFSIPLLQLDPKCSIWTWLLGPGVYGYHRPRHWNLEISQAGLRFIRLGRAFCWKETLQISQSLD